MAERNAAVEPARSMHFRIGVNLGDVIYDDTRIYGDGINIAARLESIAEPGGICISGKVYDEINSRIEVACHDIGEQQLKNITRPVRTYRVKPFTTTVASVPATPPLLPDKPSIAVLPFANLSGDREQDYFADGVTEDIITGLSRARWLFVIARHSSFAYKGRAILAVGGTLVTRDGRKRFTRDGRKRCVGNFSNSPLARGLSVAEATVKVCAFCPC